VGFQSVSFSGSGRSRDPQAILHPIWIGSARESPRAFDSCCHHPLVRPLTLLGFGNSLAGGVVIGLLVVDDVQALAWTVPDAASGCCPQPGAALWAGRPTARDPGR
jgi:hypothetical protein